MVLRDFYIQYLVNVQSNVLGKELLYLGAKILSALIFNVSIAWAVCVFHLMPASLTSPAG